MKVNELIERLEGFNPDAECSVITDCKSYKFSLVFGNAEGSTKENCEDVSFYVDETCQSEGKICGQL